MLDEYGVVSAECAAALAECQTEICADIGVGLTGAAGPDPHDGKPVGTVWIGIANARMQEPGKRISLFLSGSRNTNRRRAARFAIII